MQSRYFTPISGCSGIPIKRWLLRATSRILPTVWGSLDQSSWPPAVIWIPASIVGAALLLSPAYLIIRTLGAGPEAVDLLFRMRVLEILLRTLLLIITVTGACIALAVPLVWLTVRTDLPFRR